jgi:hypothetical protein
MSTITNEVERGLSWLMRALLDLDAWVRERAGEEELLVWHVGEVLCDLQVAESHLANLPDCTDSASVQEWLGEHCSDVLDVIVPHWPLHIGPLRERAARVGQDVSKRGGAAGNHDEPREAPAAAPDAMVGVVALQTAIQLVAARLVAEHLADPELARGLHDFLVDLRAIHARLAMFLPLRRFEALLPVLLAFSDDVDAMVVRWRAYGTRLRSWLDSRQPESSQEDDDAAES